MIGGLFGQQASGKSRDELVILITPTVVRNPEEARELTDEYGQRFRARHGIAADARLALYVGRVAHEKNIGFLLDVAQRMQQLLDGFVLVIAGEGPGMEALQGTVRARGLQQVVRFIGYLERAHELPDCYASADAFVFASLTETQGLVLIEAMAAGVPVVALAAMGTCDILAARRGALVLQASIDEFTAALHRLMLDDELRARLSSEARQYAAEWSDHALAGRLAYLYRSLAQAQGAPSAHANPTAPQRAIAR